MHGQGLSQGAIAREIGCSRNTVRHHLTKARLLAEHFERLSLVERLRFFLKA
jgi:DNA-binding CsgD family transcriptional regulator